MIKGLIFDLDGVIVDTAKYHYLAWKRLTEELDLEFDINDNELLKGVSRRKSFETILNINNIKMSDEDIDKYCNIKNNYYLEYINKLQPTEIFDGFREFVNDAKKKGYKIALGSASKNSNLILEKLNIKNLFDVVIDGNKVSKAKPDPEVFVLGAKSMNLKCEKCIVFEDSVAGIVAAHNGGMKAIGVGNNEVKNHADYFINGFVGMDANILVKKTEGE